MFGFIADILTSIASILLPVFFSYKALRTSDPAVLAPWLMYWTTLSLFLLVESQFYFILGWVPFYSWLRLFGYLYLVLPGQQGSVYLYRQYVHPFLEEHERQIDQMIADGHAKAKAAGMDAAKRAIEYVRVNVLGFPPRPPTPPPSRGVSYTTHLFNRFSMPSAREGLAAAGTSDIFGLIGKAMQQTAYPDATSRDAQARDLAASGALIPPHLAGDERADYVRTQREHLRTLMQAFDDEALSSGSDRLSGGASGGRLRHHGESGHMHKSRSESEFEDLTYETMPEPEQYMPDPEEYMPRGSGGHPGSAAGAHERPRPATRDSAGWSNWIWGSYGERDSAINTKKDL